MKAQFAYEFEGICIETDAYDSDGTELLRKNIVRDDIRVNHHIISYSETIRNKRIEMFKRIQEEQIAKMNKEG